MMMANNEYVIRVDDFPFGENIPLNQLYGPAKKWARSRFQGKAFVNKDSGQTIEVTGSGIDHAIATAKNPDVIHSMAVFFPT